MSTDATLDEDIHDHQYRKLIELLRDGSITINMLSDIVKYLTTNVSKDYEAFSLSLLDGEVYFDPLSLESIHRAVADYALELMIKNKE